MPREIIHPANQGTSEHRLPEIHVAWLRDKGSVTIGLETGSHSEGQYHLVDELYGDLTEKIGAQLRSSLLDRISSLPGNTTLTGTSSGIQTVNLQVISDETLGRMILDAVTASSELSTGWYSHFSRLGINTLIRILRKARDGAFGRDE